MGPVASIGASYPADDRIPSHLAGNGPYPWQRPARAGLTLWRETRQALRGWLGARGTTTERTLFLNVHAGIGMPAIAETIAHDIGRRAAGRSSEAADGQDRAEGLRHLPLL